MKVQVLKYENYEELTSSPEAHVAFLKKVCALMDEHHGANLYSVLSKNISIGGKEFSQAKHLHVLEMKSDQWDLEFSAGDKKSVDPDIEITPDPLKIEMAQLTRKIMGMDEGYDLAHHTTGYECMLKDMAQRGVKIPELPLEARGDSKALVPTTKERVVVMNDSWLLEKDHENKNEWCVVKSGSARGLSTSVHNLWESLIPTKTGKNEGVVVHFDDNFVYQKTNEGLIKHDKNEVKIQPAVGMNLSVAYKDGTIESVSPMEGLDTSKGFPSSRLSQVNLPFKNKPQL